MGFDKRYIKLGKIYLHPMSLIAIFNTGLLLLLFIILFLVKKDNKLITGILMCSTSMMFFIYIEFIDPLLDKRLIHKIKQVCKGKGRIKEVL